MWRASGLSTIDKNFQTIITLIKTNCDCERAKLSKLGVIKTKLWSAMNLEEILCSFDDVYEFTRQKETGNINSDEVVEELKHLIEGNCRAILLSTTTTFFYPIEQ